MKLIVDIAWKLYVIRSIYSAAFSHEITCDLCLTIPTCITLLTVIII